MANIFTDFWTSIYKKLTNPGETTIEVQDLATFLDETRAKSLMSYEFALECGINIIASAFSKAEIRTFHDGQEVREEEYYLWNYAPNRNQNAPEFWRKLIWYLVYYGETLVIETTNGDLLVADSYEHTNYAKYEDRFENVTIMPDTATGKEFVFNKSFRMRDVLYFRLHNRNLKDMVTDLGIQYQELMQDAVKKFQAACGERGILTVDAAAPTKNYGSKEDGTARTFNDVYNEMMTKQFKTYFNNPNGIMTMWSGFKYDPNTAGAAKKSTSEVKDIIDIDDRIVEKVAMALQIPSVLMKGDVADISNAVDNLIAFGVGPFANMIEKEICRKRYGKNVLVGDYVRVDTSRIKYSDAFGMAAQADKMIACGVWSIDEVRRKAGEPEIGEDWATKHYITKNYAGIEAADGSADPTDQNNGSAVQEPGKE